VIDETFAAQVRLYQHRLDHLIADGARLGGEIAAAPGSPGIEPGLAAWQRECAATVSQLSGGSKAHWLSRAYSEAFLVSAAGEGSQDGAVVTSVTPDALVRRIVAVLRQARTSLDHLAEDPGRPPAAPALSSRRFDFVAHAPLRARLEQVYRESQAAFDRREYGLALVGASSLLDAIITDALGQDCGTADATAGSLADLSFGERIAAAEAAQLVSAACRRLPAAARAYPSLLDAAGDLRPDADISEHDARMSLQVLRVIMRDRAPGR
jgi:hypothetical protein